METLEKNDGAIIIQIYEIVGDKMCLWEQGGQKVHQQIYTALKRGLTVEISFRNIENLTPNFLNTAIGQLYSTFTEKQIESKVRVVDIKSEDLKMLEKVVNNAKEFFMLRKTQ